MVNTTPRWVAQRSDGSGIRPRVYGPRRGPEDRASDLGGTRAAPGRVRVLRRDLEAQPPRVGAPAVDGGEPPHRPPMARGARADPPSRRARRHPPPRAPVAPR